MSVDEDIMRSDEESFVFPEHVLLAADLYQARHQAVVDELEDDDDRQVSFVFPEHVLLAAADCIQARSQEADVVEGDEMDTTTLMASQPPHRNELICL